VPCISLFLSDAHCVGRSQADVGQLQDQSSARRSGQRLEIIGMAIIPRWEAPPSLGPEGLTFFDTFKKLGGRWGKVIVLQKEPIGYPRSPYGLPWRNSNRAW